MNKENIQTINDTLITITLLKNVSILNNTNLTLLNVYIYPTALINFYNALYLKQSINQYRSLLKYSIILFLALSNDINQLKNNAELINKVINKLNNISPAYIIQNCSLVVKKNNYSCYIINFLIENTHRTI